MQEELAYFCDKVWVGVPLSQAMADPEGKIVGSRWVNCNKNDVNDPDVRCRLVAQEVNIHSDDSFYAATPPREAKRLLMSRRSSERRRGGQNLKLHLLYVRKAYVNAIPKRSICVRLPFERGLCKSVLGRPKRCM